MKISVITAVYNNAATIGHALESVDTQTHDDVEHIVIDGGSTDGTLAVIARHRGLLAKMISERDAGMYDAMNKGLRAARGDVIGILNADDFYADNRVLQQV